MAVRNVLLNGENVMLLENLLPVLLSIVEILIIGVFLWVDDHKHKQN